MAIPMDPASMNWTSLRLMRREGLTCTPRRSRGGWEYHIEIPDCTEFYWIGPREYAFLSVLDGTVSVEQAAQWAAQTLKDDAFSEAQVWQTCVWLYEHGLVTAADLNVPGSAHTAIRTPTRTRPTFSPFWSQFPLGSLDSVAKTLLPLIGPLYSPAICGLGLAFCFVVFLRDLLSPLDAGAPREIFWTEHWIWLALAWSAAKVLHEVSHAVVCRKYGGQVGAFSLALILFAPLVAVDVSSAWKFRSKWQRMHVSLAGIYSDLMLAAGLLCLAGVAYSPVTTRFCYDFAWLLAGGTLLFNANPLMRFDGYYVLSDLINIPNLYDKGSLRVQGLFHRLLGIPAPQVVSRDPGESRFVLIYGLLAAIWRVFVSFGLCLTAITMFHEVGVVIAMAGLFAWYVRPAVRFVREFLAANRWNALRLARVGFLAIAIVAFAGFGLLSLPCPWNATAPALVDFPEDALVRVETSGWVHTLHAQVGERVERGTLLMELENEDLVAECDALKLSIEKCRIKERKALSTGDTSTMQIEQEKRHAIEKQLQFKTASLDGLRVLAPVSGHLVAPDWPQLQGTYLKEGQQVCVISDERRKRLLISVPQSDSKQFSAGRTIHFRIGQNLQSSAPVSRFAPRASVVPVSDAFCSPAGGPLPAVPGDDPKTWNFLEPRFAAYVDLPESVAEHVVVGQRAQASVRADRSLMEATGQQLRRWSQELMQKISL